MSCVWFIGCIQRAARFMVLTRGVTGTGDD